MRSGSADPHSAIPGDRALYRGIGQLRGQLCDVVTMRRQLAAVRFDAGFAVLVLSRDVMPVPRRPKTMF